MFTTNIVDLIFNGGLVELAKHQLLDLVTLAFVCCPTALSLSFPSTEYSNTEIGLQYLWKSSREKVTNRKERLCSCLTLHKGANKITYFLLHSLISIIFLASPKTSIRHCIHILKPGST